MDYSERNEVYASTESSYFRRTSLPMFPTKQNDEVPSTTPRRRAPLTLYVPPNRRNVSLENGASSYRRSAPTDRFFNQINRSEYTESNFSQNFNQEANWNDVAELNKKVGAEGFNQESDKPNVSKIVNREDFYQENTKCEVVNHEDFRQEKVTDKLDQDFKRIVNELKQDIKQLINEETAEKIKRESIVEKVLKLAEPYMNGEFKQILCDMYFDKYKEKLPIKCLNVINFCISLDDNIKDFLNGELCTEQNNQETRFLKDKDGVSENSLFCQKEITEPEALDLNNLGEELYVFICKCDSFTSISGVIIDADHWDKVEEIAAQIELENKVQVEIKENSYYTVLDGSWHRVQCIKCNESTAEILFIDRGDTDNIPIDRLFKLDPKFFKLPAQAVNMSLSDLEVFSDCDGIREMLIELIFEKTVYVIVKDINAEKSPSLSVELYKIEDNQSSININELLMNKLFETVLNPLNNIKEDTSEHIQFINVNETGLFIQLETTSLRYFKLLMKVLTEKYCHDENLKKQKVVRFEENKIYFVKRSRDNKFYRARVLKFKCENTIEVLLIDSGIVTLINREDFFALEKLSTALAQYPAQAIEIQLEQITVLHSKILDHLQSLTSNSNELYVKFLKSELENNNIPTIRLFKKVHGYLISVNDTLLIEHNDLLEKKPNISESNSKKSADDSFRESKQNSVEGNFDAKLTNSIEGNLIVKQKSVKGYFDDLIKNSSVEIERKFNQSGSELSTLFKEVNCTKLCISGLLSPLVVPKGIYLDVHVTVSKDPSCFAIQLLKSKSVELKKMVCEMNAVYENYRGPKLTCNSIGVGQVYAYRCESDSQMWYRAYLLKVKEENVAYVYLCDYGYYKDVNIENLKCLKDQFYSLPYQAVWAELYGVKPVSGPFWSPETCSKFKKLTESKNFVCRVKSVKNLKDMNRRRSEPLSVETIYTVKLIDTTTDEDLYVADALIGNGEALRKNSKSKMQE